MEFQPAILELSPAPSAEAVFAILSCERGCVFFDSAARHPELGRYSYVAADPFAWIAARQGDGDLQRLADAMALWHATAMPGLPPFQGGAAGLFGYDLGQQLERLPAPGIDEFRVPPLAIGLYDVVVAFDHVQDRAWIISQGLPETEPSRRQARAEERLKAMAHHLAAGGRQSGPQVQGEVPRLHADSLAPQFPVPGCDSLTSNFSPQQYLAAVRRAIDWIFAGDVFQVNLSQRLLHPAHGDSVALYQRLRRLNPAPFAGYFDLGPFQVASASPELFLRVRSGAVETRPIKGTRPRRGSTEEQSRSAEELRQSVKDRAENIMIVDLLRNDLSRVCTAESVRVRELCAVESYEHVFHLVSAVCGQLRDGLGPLDLLQAAFPGGSVTGAPKIRAMEIIAELEPTARGAYCGSLGYLGFDGAADWSILIRTITAGRGWWQAPVGGGIVAQSLPEEELEETWHKAQGLLQAME